MLGLTRLFKQDAMPNSPLQPTLAQVFEQLRAIHIFAALEDSVLNELAGKVTWKRHKKGDMIVTQDSADDSVMLLVSGLIRVQITTSTHRELILRDLGAGEVFGHFAAIDGSPRSANIVALEHCLVGYIQADCFVDTMIKNPSVAYAHILNLCGIIRHLNDRLEGLAVLAVGQRIHAELLAMATPHPANPDWLVIDKMPSHIELAARVFTQRETVAREMSKLLKAGVLVKEGHACVITAPAFLRASQD